MKITDERRKMYVSLKRYVRTSIESPKSNDLGTGYSINSNDALQTNEFLNKSGNKIKNSTNGRNVFPKKYPRKKRCLHIEF